MCSTPETKKQSQTIELNLALALILTPVLECKITGTSLLTMRLLNPTCTETLLLWCDEVNIFGVFFNKCIHSELIKRSPYLLDFLHKHERLTESELNLIWHVATKKHEAFRNAVFKCLTFLVGKSFNLPILRFLFEKIKLIAYKDHNRCSLDLLKSLLMKLAPK